MFKPHTWALLFGGVLFACAGPEPSNNSENDDTSDSSSIIEYELNETRLSAVEYNDELSFIQQGVYDQINELFLSDPLTVGQNLENTKFEIDIKLSDLKQLEPYEGGEDFKAALVSLLAFYQDELNTGFEEILPSLEKEQEERTAEEIYHINDYDESFASKEQVFFAKIDSTQNAFAQANQIQIVDL